MYVPEAYSVLQQNSFGGHFAVGGKQMSAAVASGSSDAFDAYIMFNARVSELTKGEDAGNLTTSFTLNPTVADYVL